MRSFDGTLVSISKLWNPWSFLLRSTAWLHAGSILLLALIWRFLHLKIPTFYICMCTGFINLIGFLYVSQVANHVLLAYCCTGKLLRISLIELRKKVRRLLLLFELTLIKKKSLNFGGLLLQFLLHPLLLGLSSSRSIK